MKKTLVTFATLVALGSLASAERITTTVHGMVCAFCATGIEKTFKKEPAVATVKVDLPRQQVVITTKPGQTLSDAKIKEVVSYSGYKLDGIVRVK